MQGRKLNIGNRLRLLRKSLGLTQAQMATQLEVSPSYITLIETDQRPASAKLLMKLAQTYDMNISELAPEVDTQLASDFTAALKDPALELPEIPKSEIAAVLQASPRIAAALVRLHTRQNEAAMHALTDENPLTDRNKVEVLGQLTRPVEQMRDWLHERRNYIEALDQTATALAKEMALHREEPHLALSDRLKRHGIKVRTLPSKVMDGSLRRYNPHHRELLLSELLGSNSRRFQIGVLLARLEFSDLLEDTVREAAFEDPEAISLARVSFANYFAAALLMPYDRFLTACEQERYDIELIGHRFGASYEQVAHRMTTLQRPDARGIPFFFVRIDRAGNVSKRFSAGRFPFSRFGGTCPLWNIHGAFETPLRVQTQLIRMPEGASYISIARTVTRLGSTHDAPAQRHAIGLGCDRSYAARLVYADGLDLEKTEPTDIGLNCYLCEKHNCASRAQAPINRKLAINERERSLALFRFEGEE